MVARVPRSAAVFGALVCAAVAACSSTGAPPSSAPASGSVAANVAASATPAESLTIYHADPAQVELIASSGRRVLIDVWDPTLLSKPVTADDILLTTHSHEDHYDAAFVDAFPGQKITFEEGQINLADVSIVSIPAVHDEGQSPMPKDGSDYIFIIDIAGFRVGHFGDLGQDRLTDEQMVEIGKVDIAFSQLYNPYSTMDEVNQKGFNQMKQVKPLIFVPTHFNTDTARLAAKTWKAVFSVAPVTITRSQLPTETTVLFLGLHADSYGAMLNLEPASW